MLGGISSKVKRKSKHSALNQILQATLTRKFNVRHIDLKQSLTRIKARMNKRGLLNISSIHAHEVHSWFEAALKGDCQILLDELSKQLKSRKCEEISTEVEEFVFKTFEERWSNLRALRDTDIRVIAQNCSTTESLKPLRSDEILKESLIEDLKLELQVKKATMATQRKNRRVRDLTFVLVITSVLISLGSLCFDLLMSTEQPEMVENDKAR